MIELSRRNFTLGLTAAAGLAAASPAFSAKKSKKSRAYDVIILGAGAAGLNAAWMLEQEGMKVLVLEGRQRVGGRIHTLFDLPGYPEMGFNSMGEGYGRGIDAANRVGLNLVDITGRGGKGTELFIGGKRLTREEWAASPLNPFPDQLKTTMPWELVNKLVFANNPLEDWSAWLDPSNAALDVSLHQFLSAQGLSDAAIRLANDTSPYYGTSAHDVSALMLEFNAGFVMANIAAGPRMLAIEGGNEKLPIAMRNMLKGDVLLGKEVIGIDNRDDGTTVVCADGTRYDGARVISTLPYSTLRNVKITPDISGPQAQAISTLPYQPLSIAVLTATEPFWDQDGMAPGMWTDSHLGSVIPQYFGKDKNELTGFCVQARGHLANYWDRIGHEVALQRIVAQFEELRPAAKGKLKAHKLFSWGAQHFNAGDWAYFAPGQVKSFVAQMAEPVGRLHFAGEHTGVGARGLEAALESSERAVLEILSA